MSAHFLSTVSLSHLKRIAQLRAFLLVVLWVAFGVGLSLGWMNSVRINIASVLTLFTLYQIACVARLASQLPVVQTEFFVQLLLDISFLNVLFYLSGGANNPFVSYLLVPVCISAATLPWRFTWIISGICVIAYSLLLFFYIPLPLFAIEHEHSRFALSWHIVGMWFNFFVSAILITYFVVKMAQTIRDQERDLTKMREDELRSEQVIAVATLAAGAAHEINTPLSTMKVLLSELEVEHAHQPPLAADIRLLKQQVDHCATILKQLVRDSGLASDVKQQEKLLGDYVAYLMDRWLLLKPQVQFTLQIDELAASHKVAFNAQIDMAILNLLNNAADASPLHVALDISIDAQTLVWRIKDVGAGILPSVSDSLGKKPMASATGGLGLGVMLSHATLNHFGGEVIQFANHPVGTITEIRLPLVSSHNK